MSTRTYYSSFYPSETAAGSKGSAAFLSNTNTFIVYLYKRSATTLVDADKPNGDVIYTFNTGNINIAAVTNGWSATVPTGTDALYLVGATATGTDPTDTILPNEWTTPALLGSAGTNGLSNATVFLFQRNNTGIAPAVPSTSTTYTFATGILSGTYTGWSQTAPDSAGGKYLFITTATAISATATDTIPNTEWATVRILAQDGADGYTAYLTNESHTLPATFGGVVSAYTGATGSFIILKNGTDVSSNFTLSTVSNPQVLTVAYSTNTYTISGGFDSAEDSATLTIRATGSGIYAGVTIDKVFSLGKSKGGADGSAAKLMVIYSDKQAFTLNGAGAYVPSGQIITFSATKQNTSAVVNWTTSPAVTIKDLSGNPTTTGDSVRIYASDTGANTAIEVTATLTDGTTITDKITIVKVQDGAAGANGQRVGMLEVYQWAATIPTSYPSGTSTYTWATGTYTAPSTPNSWTLLPGTGAPGQTLWAISINVSDNATTATSTANWNSSTVYAVGFYGNNGTNGISAKTLVIYSNKQTFTLNSAGAYSPSGQIITFNALKQNTTNTVNWSTNPAVTLKDGAGNSATTGDVIYLYATDTGANASIEVTATLTDGTTLTDKITVIKVQDGANGINSTTGFLTNESHTVATATDGTGYDLTNAGGILKVYNGTTDVTTSSSFVGTSTLNGLTLTVNASTGAYTLSGASWTSNSEAFTITASYNGVTIPKIYSISKSKTGAKGTDAISGLLTNEAYVTSALGDGTGYSLTSAGGTFKVYNGITDVTTSATFSGTVTQNGLTFTIGASTGAYSLSGASWTSDRESFTATAVYGGVTLTKVYSISKTKAGATGIAGISGMLTSDSINIFTYADGTPVSYTNTAGYFKVYSGGTDVTASSTFSTAVATGCTGTVNTADNTPVNGAVKGYYIMSAITADTSTLSMTATYTPPGGSALSITKVFTVTKAKAGYEIVSTLPVGNLFQGRTVFLTTDNKLYRYTGSAWVTSVPAVDISGTLTDAQLAGLAATKITGTLSDSQLAGLAASKLTGTITASQIAANTITAAQIYAGAVQASRIQTANLSAGVITANEIATDAITANKILAGEVIAGKLGVNSVVAANITANNITANKLVMNSRPIYTPYLQFKAGEGGTNVISWNSALMKYINDAGAFVDVNTTGGSFTWPDPGSGGNFYIYWTPPSTSFLRSGDLNTAAAAGNVVLGWYNASDQWYPLYGETVVSGSFIQTGAITANNIAANTITANKLAASNITVALGVGATGKITLDGANNRILITD